jgi:hypothetical protein
MEGPPPRAMLPKSSDVLLSASPQAACAIWTPDATARIIASGGISFIADLVFSLLMLNTVYEK